MLALEGVLCLGFVKCVIWICQMCDWIWIGRVSFVEKLNFQAVIKSAATSLLIKFLEFPELATAETASFIFVFAESYNVRRSPFLPLES